MYGQPSEPGGSWGFWCRFDGLVSFGFLKVVKSKYKRALARKMRAYRNVVVATIFFFFWVWEF